MFSSVVSHLRSLLPSLPFSFPSVALSSAPPPIPHSTTTIPYTGMSSDTLFHTAIAVHTALEVYKDDTRPHNDKDNGHGNGDEGDTLDDLDPSLSRPLLDRLSDFASAAAVRRWWSSSHAHVTRLIDGDTHMLLLHTPTTVYVAIRGSHSRADWYTNVAGAFRPPARTRHGAKVHGPWAARAAGAAAALVPHLPRPSTAGSGPTIVFTGHSLGGALACLVADELLGMRALSSTPIIITFGSPPFGGASVARMTTLHDIIRITQHGDLAALQGVTPAMSRQLGHLYTIDGMRFTHHSADQAHDRFGSMGMVTKGAILAAQGVQPHSIRMYAKDVLAICAAGLAHWRNKDRETVERPRFRAAL